MRLLYLFVLCLLGYAGGFPPRAQWSRRRQAFRQPREQLYDAIRRLANANGDKDSNEADKDNVDKVLFVVQRKSKRPRSFDYPPSLYVSSASEKKSRKRGESGFSLKVQWPGGATEQVYNKNVSIPSNRDFAARSNFGDRTIESVEREALKTRLLNERYYARDEAFDLENLHRAPGLEDLVEKDVTSWTQKFWITLPARLLTFGLACLIFPYIIQLLDRFVTMQPENLDDITSRFGPGISILYGTFTSLTISILYQRQKAIQEAVASEASLLVLMLRNVLSLFRGEEERALEAGQTVADQVRTLVKSSRGVELMGIMYTDPYARLFELVDDFEYHVSDSERARKASLFGSCRDLLKDLTRFRSVRLAEEARALPPTHFLILNVLTTFILLSYCLNVLPTLDRIGREPPPESILIFGLLTSIYIVFYNFADDLNQPFEGVYQVRRSAAASHLLEAKWLIANHPVLRDEVDFEVPDETENNGVLIRTPGIGDCVFEKDEFFVGMETEDDETPFKPPNPDISPY